MGFYIYSYINKRKQPLDDITVLYGKDGFNLEDLFEEFNVSEECALGAKEFPNWLVNNKNFKIIEIEDRIDDII